MYQEERLQLILDYLRQNKRISIEDICTLYNVSRDTARRDIVNLAKQGAIIRTHGGAILPSIHEKCKIYSERLLADMEEKCTIAKNAACLIKEGDTIIFDTSTTVQVCAQLLANLPCTIITNSVNTADILADKTSITTIMLGGRLNHTHRFVYGSTAVHMLSDYFADKAFIGALGISEQGITAGDDEDAAVVRKMVQQSREVIVLADHSKFDRTDCFRVCTLSAIHTIVTDRLPSEPLLRALTALNINIIIAE